MMHSPHEAIFAQESGSEITCSGMVGKISLIRLSLRCGGMRSCCVSCSSTRSPAEGKLQREILGFYQGFGKAGAVVDQGGEIYSGIIRERTIDRVNRSQGQGL